MNKRNESIKIIASYKGEAKDTISPINTSWNWAQGMNHHKIVPLILINSIESLWEINEYKNGHTIFIMALLQVIHKHFLSPFGDPVWNLSESGSGNEFPPGFSAVEAQLNRESWRPNRNFPKSLGLAVPS